MCEHLWPTEDRRVFEAADVIFCDSIAMRQVSNPKVVPYRLIAPASLDYLSSAIQSFGPS